MIRSRYTLYQTPKLPIIDNFCKEVAYKYQNILKWHPMTVTIYKILIQRHAIMQNSSVPMGMLSEQFSESQ